MLFDLLITLLFLSIFILGIVGIFLTRAKPKNPPGLSSGSSKDNSTERGSIFMALFGAVALVGILASATFAFLNGLWVGGILSVLAMAVGTAITVSLLATLAVTAKDWAVTLAGDGRLGNRVHTAVEIGGAALVFVFGLLLLSASLSA